MVSFTDGEHGWRASAPPTVPRAALDGDALGAVARRAASEHARALDEGARHVLHGWLRPDAGRRAVRWHDTTG